MSNNWFQRLYSIHKDAFFDCLKEAIIHKADIRLSVNQDGTVTFSSDDGDILRTITQDQESISYMQYHEFPKNEED